MKYKEEEKLEKRLFSLARDARLNMKPSKIGLLRVLDDIDTSTFSNENNTKNTEIFVSRESSFSWKIFFSGAVPAVITVAILIAVLPLGIDENTELFSMEAEAFEEHSNLDLELEEAILEMELEIELGDLEDSLDI